MSQGILFVISAPSGAGKTSLVKELRVQVDGFSVSISHTTRTMRPGEIDGVDYYFTNSEKFEEMIAAGEFLEYAKVFGNYYGTAQATVENALSAGKDVLLEIDWQGARQIKKLLPDCQSLFILPPSREALWQRLQKRGQDNAETIERRMRESISEMSHFNEYDYLIINDDFNQAVDEMRSIVVASRLKTSSQSTYNKDLIANLLG